MEDSRRPKICLNEILRNISNKNDSRWGANFRRRWEEWGEPEIPTKVMSWEAEMTRDRMERGLKIGIEQELQEDWFRIDNSTYLPTYKRIKEGTEREKKCEGERNKKLDQSKMWKHI